MLVLPQLLVHLCTYVTFTLTTRWLRCSDLNRGMLESKSSALTNFATPQQSMILYILIKHFTPDLRLANQCSRHIRSMVTIDLCLPELLVNNQSPWGTPPSRPCEILFPRNFQSMFSRKNVKNLHNFSCIARRFLLLVPPTYVILTFLCLNYDYLVIWHYQQ